MSHTRPLLAALALTATAALAGCGSDDAGAETAGSTETVTWTWDRNTAGEDEDPVYEETSVEVPLEPENIVVFDVAALDTVGALGAEVSGAPLDYVPDYLEGYLADDAINAGSLFEADLVEIEASQPDLIIVGGRSSGLWEDLNDIAPTIDLSINGSFLDTLEANTTFLGEVLGAQDVAEEKLADLEAGIAEAQEATAEAGTGLGVLVSGGALTALSPSSDGSDGQSARGGLIYDVFGVEPVIDDIESATHGEPISFEFVLEADPDYLWVVDRDAAVGEEDAQPAAEVLDNAIIDETTAAQEGQVVYLDPVAWYIVFGGLDTTQLMIDDVMQIAS